MNTTARRTGLLALILAVCAIGASPAGARPIDDPTIGAPDGYTVPVQPLPAAEPNPVVENSPATGFDWGDAGIGAAVVAGLALLAGGGAVALTHRRSVSSRTATLG